ncbi:MAG: Rieske 2Fe-2S domain-containing protein [Myxococcales bacterium]
MDNLNNPVVRAFSDANGERNKSQRHHWWPVAYSSELGSDKPLAIKLFGEPLALFRGKDRVGCVADVCPHKSAALSAGFVENGELACRYHGWRFDPGGACSYPEELRDRRKTARYAYPALDDGLLIWVFPSTDEPVEFVNPVLEHARRVGAKIRAFKPRKFEFDQPWELWAASFVDGTHHEYAHPKTFMESQRDTLTFMFDPALSPAAMVVRGRHDRTMGVLAYLTFSPEEEGRHKQFLTLFPTSDILPGPLSCGIFRTFRIAELLYQVVYEDYYLIVKQAERIRQGASKWGIRGRYGAPTSDQFIDWHRERELDPVWFHAYGADGMPVLGAGDASPRPGKPALPILQDSGPELGPTLARTPRATFEDASPSTWSRLALYDRVVKGIAEGALRMSR